MSSPLGSVLLAAPGAGRRHWSPTAAERGAHSSGRAPSRKRKQRLRLPSRSFPFSTTPPPPPPRRQQRRRQPPTQEPPPSATATERRRASKQEPSAEPTPHKRHDDAFCVRRPGVHSRRAIAATQRS